MVLPIAGPDIEATSSGNSAVFRGLTNSARLWFLIFNFIKKARLRFRAEENKISHHRQYLAVICNL